MISAARDFPLRRSHLAGLCQVASQLSVPEDLTSLSELCLQHRAAEKRFRRVTLSESPLPVGQLLIGVYEKTAGSFFEGNSRLSRHRPRLPWLTEQDAVHSLYRDLKPLIPMEVFKGESAQSQKGSISTRKRAGPDNSDASMKRQRTEQTRAQDVSSCGTPVHGTRQKLKPSLPTFAGGLMQASYLESPRMETPVGEAAMGGRPKERKKEEKRMASMCAHQHIRSRCKECKGSSICEHQRQRSRCKECKGSSICEHQRIRSTCKECKGSGICEHQRRRSTCKECKGSSICEHQRRRSTCEECKGSSICEHQS